MSISSRTLVFIKSGYILLHLFLSSFTLSSVENVPLNITILDGWYTPVSMRWFMYVLQLVDLPAYDGPISSILCAQYPFLHIGLSNSDYFYCFFLPYIGVLVSSIGILSICIAKKIIT